MTEGLREIPVAAVANLRLRCRLRGSEYHCGILPLLSYPQGSVSKHRKHVCPKDASNALYT